MEEFVAEFQNLLQYVPYIKKENAKVYISFNYLPVSCKESIEFKNPKEIGEAMRNEKLCYQKFKKYGRRLKILAS